MSALSSLQLLSFEYAKMPNDTYLTGFATVPALQTLSLIAIPNVTFAAIFRNLSVLSIDGYIAAGFILPARWDPFQNLTSLTLRGRLQSGGFPSGFFNLPKLVTLRLELTSGPEVIAIPPDISNLTRVESIYLYGSYIGGSIPPLSTFPYLKSYTQTFTRLNVPDITGALLLESFTAQYSTVTVTMPSVGPAGTPSLKSFVLTQISGGSSSFPWPVVNVTNLEYLTMSYANVEGSIPDYIFGPSLRSISLVSLMINGSIPETLSTATNLTSIYLYSLPNLKGDLPCRAGGLPNLTSLAISTTGISSLDSEYEFTPLTTLSLFDNAMFSLPDVVTRMTSLQVLSFSTTNFSAQAFPDLSRLSQLRSLSLVANIVSQLPTYFTSLNQLSLTRTSITGLLDQRVIANLTSLYIASNTGVFTLPPLSRDCRLTDLTLTNSGIVGPIPPQIFNCSNLGRLYLYGNQFGPVVPKEIFKLPSLDYAYLDMNRFSELENSTGDGLHFGYAIGLSQNNFSGPVTPEIVSTVSSNFRYFDLRSNRLECPQKSIAAAQATWNKQGLYFSSAYV